MLCLISGRGVLFQSNQAKQQPIILDAELWDFGMLLEESVGGGCLHDDGALGDVVLDIDSVVLVGDAGMDGGKLQ